MERMLIVLLTSAENLRRGKVVDRKILDGGIDFLTNFVEKCHHRTEEEVLFPAMRGRTKRSDGEGQDTIRLLLDGHRQCRTSVKELAKGVGTLYGSGSKRSKANAIIKIVEKIRSLSDILRHHIAAEEGGFFPMCESELADGEKEKVAEKFGENGACEKWLSLIRELEKLAA